VYSRFDKVKDDLSLSLLDQSLPLVTLVFLDLGFGPKVSLNPLQSLLKEHYQWANIKAST
jgi:hypothetical protein